MVATIAAGTTSEYYLAASDYYTGSREPQGRWLKVGLDVEISAGTVVDPVDFQALHSGIDRAGRPLIANDGNKLERVGGYDVTLSAPKSVSERWALGSFAMRTGIEHAQARAVEAVAEVIERHAAFCRSGKGGVHRERVTITAAAFQHGEARPAEHSDGKTFADPNLHTHLVVMNLGKKSASHDKVGALDGRPLFAWKKALGATYHLALAHELGKIGLQIESVGDNGVFEVAGVERDLCEYFSARRRVITESLEEAGLTSAQSPALAASIARTTRLAKRVEPEGDRHEGWRNRAIEMGYDLEALQERCLALGPASRERGAADDDASLRKRIDDALHGLTEQTSCFSRRDLHAAVASALVGAQVGVESIEREIERLLHDDTLVTLDRDDWHEEIFTTAEMLRIEKEIGEMVRDLQSRHVAGPAFERVEQIAAAHGLSAEQAFAVQAATSGAALTIVEGAPGSGKTTTLKPIKESWEELGYRVIGAATAWRIANNLRDDLSIEARATDSWLARARVGKPFLDERTVLVLDEAGLLSSRQMHSVLSEATASARLGQAPRLVLVGDRKQLQSVGAGSGLRLVAAAQEVQAVETIQRQCTPWLVDAIRDFGNGEAGKAVAAFSARGHLHERVGEQATISALVDAWEAARPEKAEQDMLMIAKTNAEVRAISKEVRNRMRRDGLLPGDDVTVKAVTPSGHTVPLALAEGDKVRFLKRLKIEGIEVVNGTHAIIEAIRRDDDGEIRMSASIGERRVAFAASEIADEQGRARIAYAYATTIHGSQGLTTDKAFVLLSPRMDRHDVYVAASRARDATELFVDRRALDAEVIRQLPLSDRGRGKIDEEMRNAHLAARLSRAGVKLTTLDVMLRAEENARRRELARDETSRLERVAVLQKSRGLSLDD